MKRILGLIIILSFLIIKDVYSQNKDYDNSICWEIKSVRDSKPSFIFGSVHALDTSKIYFPIPKVKELVDSCDCFCCEIKNSPVDNSQMRKLIKDVFLSDRNINLRDSIGSDYYKNLIQIVDSSKGPLKVFKPMISMIKPGFIGLLVTMEKQTSNTALYSQANFTMDSYFQLYAQSKGYEINELESIQKQLEMISSGTYQESISALKTCIDKYNLKDSVDMLRNYFNQNLRLLDESGYLDSTMIARNKNMADGIDRLMKEKSVFVIIGAAHLPFRFGVLNLLSQKGYIVKPHPIEIEVREIEK